MNIENCKTLNDIARQEFGKANYTNREKCKKLLEKEGIDWKEWLKNNKIKEKKYCLYCGKEIAYNKNFVVLLVQQNITILKEKSQRRLE